MYKPLDIGVFNRQKSKLFVDKRGLLYRFHIAHGGYRLVDMKKKVDKHMSEVLHNYFVIIVDGKDHRLTQPQLKKFYETGELA